MQKTAAADWRVWNGLNLHLIYSKAWWKFKGVAPAAMSREQISFSDAAISYALWPLPSGSFTCFMISGFSRSQCTTKSCFESAAQCKQFFSSLSSRIGSARAWARFVKTEQLEIEILWVSSTSRRRRQGKSEPTRAVIIKGVNPLMSWAFISALLFNKQEITIMFPCSAARWSGVCPSYPTAKKRIQVTKQTQKTVFKTIIATKSNLSWHPRVAVEENESLRRFYLLRHSAVGCSCFHLCNSSNIKISIPKFI